MGWFYSVGFKEILLLAIVMATYVAFMSFMINTLKKTAAFLKLPESSVNGYKHPRNKMMFFVLKLWGFIFVLAFCSVAFIIILWAAVIVIWIPVILILYSFAKLWKKHGYSIIILLLSTGAVTVISFSVSFLIKDIIFK